VQFGESPTFWSNIRVSSSLRSNIKQSKKSCCCLLQLAFYAASAPKMEALSSSETSGSLRNARRYSPEGRTLYSILQRTRNTMRARSELVVRHSLHCKEKGCLDMLSHYCVVSTSYCVEVKYNWKKQSGSHLLLLIILKQHTLSQTNAVGMINYHAKTLYLEISLMAQTTLFSLKLFLQF
jgi:hypothetical protein